MRQFICLATAAYLIVGVGTGLVFYAEHQTQVRREARQDHFVVESVMAGLFWPFHINAVLTGHDARKLS